jgi:hypothetical protein
MKIDPTLDVGLSGNGASYTMARLFKRQSAFIDKIF